VILDKHLMKRFFTLIAAFVLCISLYGQNDTAYIHTFGGIQNDGCKQVQPTPDGGYIMIGTTSSFGAGNTDFYAIKTDSLCNFKWSKTYGGASNEEGFSVTPTLDKGYAFVGFTDSYGAGGYDVFLVKTDSMGNEKWQKTYGGSNWDFGYSIKQLKDSGYIICGLTYSYGSTNGSIYVIRTDKMGDTLWTRTVGNNSFTVGNALAVWEDSLYIIAGATTSYGVSDTNAILVEINEKGTTNWIRVFGDSTNKTFNSIQVTPDKAFLLYGRTDSMPNSTHKDTVQFEFLLKTDSLGKLLLISPSLLPSANNGSGSDARQIADGSFLSLGCNASFGAGGYDFTAFHLNPGGWYMNGSTYGGPKNEISGSMAIGKNGDLILAGSSNSYPLFSCGLWDVFMVRIKAINILPNTYDTVVYRYRDTTQWPAFIPIQKQYQVGVNVYPNPIVSSSTILVQGGDFDKYTFRVFTINGQNVIDNFPLKNIGHGQSVSIIKRGSLSAGEYMYEVISNGNTKVASGKLIME
jgi:hypothetical protein